MSFLAETWLFWSLFFLGLVLFRQALRSLVGQFLFERFLLALFTLLLVSIVIFALMEVVTGDCATRMIAYKNTQGIVITDADIKAERKLHGLDGAVYERWGEWVYGLVTEGDLGFSCEKRAPVQQVRESLPHFFSCLWTGIAVCLLLGSATGGDFCDHHDPTLG
ncbi:MAG: hypothetical protein P8O70_11450 [SAR324 cluster bacterium]|nr:hypothetical protein [SAR324 cluster bacterium]